MPPCSVLFITDRFPPQVGGVAISAERLTRGLAGRGFGVHVLSLDAEVEPGAVQSSREGDVMVHRIGSLGSPDLTLQLADNVIEHLQQRVGFQILHGHFLTPSGYLAAFYARRFGAKSFAAVRGNDVDRGMFAGAQFPFILWTLQHADAIGCVSRELAEKCAVLSGRDDIHFTPNSVDLDVFRPQSKDAGLVELLGAEGQPVLGFVGELRFKKGTHFLVDAFRAVREKLPARLLLVGGMRGEDRSFLRRYLREYPDLRPAIHTVGYVHDRAELCRYYNTMDVVLCPSLWDGMPNSVLEAMACGRPVIATSVGGIRDVIRHGENGLLVDIHDLHRLGEGCLEVLEAGEDTRAAIGQQARAHVEQNHRPELELERLARIYTSLVGASPS